RSDGRSAQEWSARSATRRFAHAETVEAAVSAAVIIKQMAAEVKKEIELEIAYVLFIDLVGYSKLVTAEQRRLLEVLNRIVREAEHFHTAEANGRLITVPTGADMALVFYNTPESPAE